MRAVTLFYEDMTGTFTEAVERILPGLSDEELAEFIDFLERHSQGTLPKTIRVLHWDLGIIWEDNWVGLMFEAMRRFVLAKARDEAGERIR